MGFTYDELSIFGKLRKCEKLGPLQMFHRLCDEWKDIGLTREEVALKVKRFFFFYSINRHKSTVITPSYHMASYSPDDNRFDLRPFLYESSFKWQFEAIDNSLKNYNQ